MALAQFSLTSRLVFLVVGPVMNLTRFSAQTARFGPTVALRYGPAALLGAALIAAAIGSILL